MIQRKIEEIVKGMLGQKKAIVILGARQVGKSTSLENLMAQRDGVMWMNGDDPDIQRLFENMTSTRLQTMLADKRFLVIDEAQRISDIGMKLKLVADQMKNVQIIATGSSSFQLRNKLNEPLTGRKRELRMFPLTMEEMARHNNLLEELRLIPHRMVYGYYPEVVTSVGNECEVLRELVDSYLYRDVLALEGIMKSEKLVKLVQALAFQIGNQVSLNEVGRLVGLDVKTVDRYIDILEKSFIIFRLPSFSRNLRNELKASRKIFFWDLGVRNAVIGNMAQIENRSDTGALWENYCIAERMKKLAYERRFSNSWFWRTQQKKEIDYLEEVDGTLSAYEFKWNPHKANTKCPVAFTDAYPTATYKVVTPDNVEEFLL